MRYRSIPDTHMLMSLLSSRWGIFRLTDPPGLPHVLHCNHTDTFHQHSIDNIYTDAGNPPGHVYETSSLEFSVHDLRPKQR